MIEQNSDPNTIDGERVASEEAKYLIYGEVANEVRVRLEDGRQVDVDELLARYPGSEPEVRQLISAMTALKQADEALQTVPGRETAGDQGDLVPRQLGDYRILREIGRGGMGVVYEAHQISLDRRVALKVLPFAAMLDNCHLRRFENEARSAATLHHPNIVPIFGVGCERGVHYYAMQFIDGQTLAEFIREYRGTDGRNEESQGTETAPRDETDISGNPPEDMTVAYRRTSAQVASPIRSVNPAKDTRPNNQALSPTRGRTESTNYFQSVARFVFQVANALDHAHESGVIHRDIKPSNLILDADGKAWITDFGLAHLESNPSLTVTGDIIGTLKYMSPEQASGNRPVLDHRTDIYSLGATLYELLTLEPAVSGKDSKETLRCIANEEPVRPRKLNRSIPPEIEAITLKAIAKNPGERYATALDLASDLERFLHDKPILARPPSVMAKTRKWAKRHKALAATMVLVLTLTITVPLLLMAVRHGRVVQLREAVELALSDADLLMAQEHFAEAIPVLQDAKTQIVDEPTLQREFAVRLDEALRTSEVQLRFHLFDRKATDARFFVNRALRASGSNRPGREKMKALEESIKHCKDSLDLYGELKAAREASGHGGTDLDDNQQKLVRMSRIETLALLAQTEVRVGQQSDDGQEWLYRALSHLEEAERLAPSSFAIRELAAEYRKMVGKETASDGEAQRTAVLDCSEWLDYFLLGTRLQSDGDFEGALKHLDAALVERVGDYWTWYCWSECQWNLKRADRALWAVSVCMRLRPEEPSSWLRRAQLHRELAEYSKAVEDYTTALARIEGMADDKREFSFVAYRGRARLYEDLGQLDVALNDMNALLQMLSPRSARATWALVDRARVHRKMGNLDLAQADARRVVETLDEPSRYWQYFHRYFALRAIEDWDGMVNEANGIIALTEDPHEKARRSGFLVKSYLGMNRIDQAIKTTREAQRVLAPAEIVTQLHEVAWHIVKDKGNGHYLREALAFSQQLVAVEPDAWRHHRVLGAALCRNGEWKESIQSLEKAIDLKEATDVSWESLFLAMAYWELGQEKEARDCYAKAIEPAKKIAQHEEGFYQVRAEVERLLHKPTDK